MKDLLWPLICAGLLYAPSCFAQKEVFEEMNRLEVQGQFRAAAACATQALARANVNAPDRKRLEFEADRLRRIRRDFPYTKEDLFALLKKSVKGLTKAEYEGWVREGRFDTREIDGRQYFMASSVGNLFFRYPELEPRRTPARNTAALERAHWETCVAIKQAAAAQKKPYVLPKRFQVDFTVTANPGAAPAGHVVRAWLPIPRDYPFQGDFRLLSSTPQPKHIDPKEGVIRSAYFEQTAAKGKPTEFKLQYEYTTHGVWFNPTRGNPQTSALQDPALEAFTREEPHVLFTPEIRELSRKIAGDEADPCAKAKKFYDWIGENIKYSYAIEYSTIRNISEYCRSHSYGDCGQEALLFITLCRLNGIPARWQSGWNTFPDAQNIHDWSEIYLQPYGWIPVDPYMSIYAMRYANTLTPAQKRELRDFYFGGLDQYRMVANRAHSQDLVPPKQSMRSDDVDFQRGELEWGSHNIYFDQYSWKFSTKELKVREALE